MNNIGLHRNRNAAQAKNIQIGVVPRMESILVLPIGLFFSNEMELVFFLLSLSASMPPVSKREKNRFRKLNI